MIPRGLNTLLMAAGTIHILRFGKVIIDFCSFPMEMHIVHKKVGENNFLEVEGGLAVTGFFFEVNTKCVNNESNLQNWIPRLIILILIMLLLNRL